MRPAGVLLLCGVLAGCASQTALSDATAESKGDRARARELYEGESAVVHGTEYPVTSAAEGLVRGDAAWRKGDLDLAVYLYVQSLAYDATNPDALLRIGAIHERRGNKALAAKAFELALKLNPDDPAINERLGLLYLQEGNTAAVELLEHAIAEDPSRWQSHNGLGIAADRRGSFTEAISHYDAALAIEPRAASVANNRGYSHYLAGDFAGAETEFRLALGLGAQSGAWTNLGRAQARQRKYEEALESLLKEHDEAHARNLLGEAAMEGGDLDTAQSEFALALSAAPRYFQAAHENLELVTERIAERTMQQASKGANTTAAIAPTAYAVAPRIRQAGYDPQGASCTGAAALKPRCNPYAAKRPKAYRVASYRPPRN